MDNNFHEGMQKMDKRFHVHVATQVGGNRNELLAGLEDLGFAHDVVLGGVEGLPDSQQICHMTDLHMTLKVETVEESSRIADLVDQLMRKTETIGYFHTERCENKLPVDSAFKVNNWRPNSHRPFPAHVFRSAYRPMMNKTWDLHGSVAEDELPLRLKKYLLDQGMYFIRREKPDGKIYTIFTIQGVSPDSEGLELFQRLVGWWASIEGPKVVLQWESTLRMAQYGQGLKIVPPTIERVEWR